MWNLLQDELGGGVWPRLLVALVDTGAKGLILMAAAGLAAAALRRNAAAARHLVWMLALCGLLILPVVSLMMPKWTLPILPAIEAPAEAQITATPPLATAPAAPAVDSTPMAEIPPKVPHVVSPSTERSERPPAPIGATQPESAQAPINYGAWLLATWLAFALLSLAPFAAGIVAVARMRRRAEVFSEGDLQSLASALGRSIGLKRPARLLRGPAGSMPMATGFLRPAVFLPEDALAWTEEKRRVVLLHELAHVKRRDCLAHAVARTATALHWFNPLAWLALRQLRIEREHACDDLVLAAGERPSAYAENLLEIARTLRASTVVSAAAITMAQKSQLEGRLLAVLDAASNRGLVTRKFAVICIATLSVVVSVLSAVAVTREIATTGDLLAIAKPVKKTSLESFFGGWRNLPFKLSDGNAEAIAQCLELSQRYNAIQNGVNRFSLPEVRESLEALLSKQPDFFYAEHLLGTWHQMYGNTALAEDYFLRSYRHAPVVLIQRYEHADGSPIVGAAIRQFEIECNRVQGGSLDPSLNLKYFALTTDSEGCVYLPVYDTVYRASTRSFPEGFDVSYPKLGWFLSRGRVAMLPVAASKDSANEPSTANASGNSAIPDYLKGSWAADAKEVHIANKAFSLPLALQIEEDGTISGHLGEVSISDAQITTWTAQDSLEHHQDFDHKIEGHLKGPLDDTLYDGPVLIGLIDQDDHWLARPFIMDPSGGSQMVFGLSHYMMERSQTLRFAGGLVATIVAVGDSHGANPHTFWHPDGTPIGAEPLEFESILSVLHPSKDEVEREFLLRILPQPGGPDAKDISARWRIPAPSTSGSGGQNVQDNVRYVKAAMSISQNLTSADLELGIAADPWVAVVEAGFAMTSTIGEYSLAVGKPYEQEGELTITVSHNVPFEKDCRLVAFDQTGVAHPLVSRGTYSADQFTQAHYSLESLSPKNLQRLELQVRDFEWKKFERIALNPDSAKAPKNSESPEAHSENKATPNEQSARLNDNFSVEFPGGYRASVVAIGNDGEGQYGDAWGPDGALLTTIPELFKEPYSIRSSDEGEYRRLLIEVVPAGTETDISVTWRLDGDGDGSWLHMKKDNQLYIQTKRPVSPKGSTLEIGIAAGPWDSVHGTAGPHSNANGSTFSAAYSDFFEKDGKAHVVVTHTPREDDYRLVAYDKNDTPYPTLKRSFSSAGAMRQTDFEVEGEVSASDLVYMDLQARPYEWQSISGIAMSPSEPVAEVRTEVSTIQAVVWTGMVDLSLASALPDVMEEIQQSNPPYVLYRGRREDFWRVWEQNASLANVLAVEPECHWLAESPEIGHDFVLNDAVQFPVEESLERIAHFSVSQTSHWEPDGDHAKLRFSGSASANLAHMGVRAAGAPDATVSGELAFDGTLKAGELLVYMAPMGRHLEFTPAQLIVVEAVSVPTKDAAYVRAMSDTRLWLSAGLPGLRQEVEAARAWEQLALTTPSNDQAQNIAWTSAGHVFIHPKDHHTLPLLNIVAVGRPTDWPHCWWDLAGKPVRTNPAWQDSLAGENALAIVYTLDSTQSVDLTLRGANIETRGLGSRWSSDYNDDERLLYVSDRDFANYVSAGGAVDLVARTGFGPWSEIGVIHAGETLELDGGTFRIDEVKPERARQSRLFRQDLPGKASVRGRYDFDPEWEIAVVGVDSAGNRSPVNFEFGSGLSARRENRLLALHVEMDYGEIEYLVLLKRAVAYYVISNIPTRPGAPFETNLPTKRVDADFLPNQFAPLPRSPAEEVALPTTGGSTVPLRDGISEDDAGIEDGTVALERLRPADDSIPPAVREERSTNAEDLVDERTVWGEVNRGLQAAIRLEPREGGYPIGDRIDVTILLRNAGTEIINIMTLGFLVPDTILVHDSAGNVKSTGNFKNIDISSVLSYNQIAPGQVIEIKQYPAITIVDGPIDKPDQFPWTAIAVEPGTHSIQIQTSIPPMELPDASNTPLAMYWVGPITTGKTELLILPGVTPPGLQVRWVAADWGTGLLTRVPWRDGNQPEGEPAELELLDTVLCRDADIAALEVVPGPISTQFAVRLQLRGEAIVRWGNATRGNAGKRLALVLDGKVIHAFTLLDTMAGGEMMLTGDFNRDEADSLAYAIRAANPLIADTLRVPDSATSTLGPEVEGTEADAVTQASPAKDAAVVSTAGSKDSPNSVFNHDYFNALLEDPNLLTHIAGDAITPPAAITSWGPVVNSLQAAVRFKPEKTEYQLGEKIDMEFLVRNTGPDPVEFLTSETRLFQLYLSRKISTSISVNSDLVKIRRVKLAPGEVASIDGMCNSVMLNGTRQEPEEPIGTYEEYHPNIHEVIFNLHFPDAYSNSGETAPRPGDWTGTLTTGTRPPLLTAYGAYGQAPAPAPDRQNSETGS